MVKVRLMGKKNEIIRFQKILQNCTCIEMNKPSDIFSMKGTKQYFRNYLEVQIKESKS